MLVMCVIFAGCMLGVLLQHSLPNISPTQKARSPPSAWNMTTVPAGHLRRHIASILWSCGSSTARSEDRVGQRRPRRLATLALSICIYSEIKGHTPLVQVAAEVPNISKRCRGLA